MNGQIGFFGGSAFPIEMHKVRVVQKLTLVPMEERLKALQEAGNNTFLLRNDKVFLDMLTDNGMSLRFEICPNVRAGLTIYI